MSKSGSKIDTRQVTIFAYLESQQRERQEAWPPSGSMDMDARLRAVISDCIKRCSLSRYGIAARMSELVGHEVTKSQIDSWSCESKSGHRFPAAYLVAFCKAVDSVEPLKLMAEALQVFVLPGPEALRAEIMRIDQEIAKQKKEKRRRLAFLSEVEGK
jgi:hypothetical protein